MLKASIIGNIGGDPEMKYSSSGAPYLRFNVASNYRSKNQTGEWENRTEWVRCTIFGARAESLNQYLSKGVRVFVDGRLEARPWTSSQGEVRAGLELVASDCEFFSLKQEDVTQQPARQSQPTAPDDDDSSLPF